MSCCEKRYTEVNKISLEKKGSAFSKMASGYKTDEETNDKDNSIWVLDHQMDQSMEEESRQLRNVHQEKVCCKSLPPTSFVV